MRLAVYHNLPSGGAKKFLWGFVDRARHRHDVDLYRLDDFDNESFCDLRSLVANDFRYHAGVRPRSISASYRPLQIWTKLAHTERVIAADIDSRNYDAVLVNHCQHTTSPFLLRRLRTRSLYYMQEPRRHHYEYARMPAMPLNVRQPIGTVRTLRRMAILASTKARDAASVRAATEVLCNSQYSLESIARAYGRYPTVSYLGVDDTEYVPGPPSVPRQGLLAVGALHPSKGQLLIVDAVGLLLPSRRPVVDLVFDREEPDYRQAVEKRAAEAGVAVRFHHRIDEAALIGRYQSAIATVCTSELEPFGLTPLESIACGTPVVAVREAGFRESVVDGVNGYLVDRAPEAVSEAIDKIAGGGLVATPDTLRSSLLPKFSLDAAVDRLEQHLVRMAAGDGGSHR